MFIMLRVSLIVCKLCVNDDNDFEWTGYSIMDGARLMKGWLYAKVTHIHEKIAL